MVRARSAPRRAVVRGSREEKIAAEAARELAVIEPREHLLRGLVLVGPTSQSAVHQLCLELLSQLGTVVSEPRDRVLEGRDQAVVLEVRVHLRAPVVERRLRMPRRILDQVDRIAEMPEGRGKVDAAFSDPNSHSVSPRSSGAGGSASARCRYVTATSGDPWASARRAASRRIRVANSRRQAARAAGATLLVRLRAGSVSRLAARRCASARSMGPIAS